MMLCWLKYQRPSKSILWDIIRYKKTAATTRFHFTLKSYVQFIHGVSAGAYTASIAFCWRMLAGLPAVKQRATRLSLYQRIAPALDRHGTL